jgi:hypothetical protein
MNYYVSDSRGKWETDCVSNLINDKNKFKLFQLLIHPIWWGEKSMSPRDRIVDFLDRESKNSDDHNEMEDKVRVGLPTFYKEFMER